MKRWAALLLAAAPAAWGQLALFTVEPEKPAGNLVAIGSVPAGDVLTARLRIRNVGTGPETVTMLTVSGTGFAPPVTPPLPMKLDAGKWLDFEVRFEPLAVGAYSASLVSDRLSAILTASATAAAAVSVEEGGAWRTLMSGMAVDYGTVERGTAVRRRFMVVNRTGAPLAEVPVSVAGQGFGSAAGLPERLALAHGEAASFEVPFSPSASGTVEGTLTVGPRRFVLRAIAVEPPMPQPEIVLSLEEPRSARQGRVTVRLAHASRGRASGLLRMEFEPAAPGLDDPAIAFASGLRAAAFSVEEGDTAVRFGGQGWVDFQTGSTAGTLVFTVEAGEARERATVAISPAPAAVASARAVRGASSVEVSVTGLDNTRSLHRTAFTFYGRNGAILKPGAIAVDCAAAFREYFENSGVGGVFQLRAVFPVAGEAGAIEAVEAEFTNSAGTGRTGKLAF